MLGGFALEADTKIGVFLGAAGRDPRQWPDADRYDLQRRPAGREPAPDNSEPAGATQQNAATPAPSTTAEHVRG